MSAGSLGTVLVALALLVLVAAIVLGLLQAVGVDRVLSTVGQALR